jgi:hypothetical protein
VSPATAGHRPPKNFAQQVLGQWPLAVVLSGVALGLIVVATGHWRAGCSLVGAAFTFGGVLRLLPDTRVGLLAVRTRLLDTIVLLGLGLGLAWLVPPSS